MPFTPTFKLYLLNETQALHGLYVLTERAMRLDDGVEVEALDVLGLGAMLFHYLKDQDLESQGSGPAAEPPQAVRFLNSRPDRAIAASRIPAHQASAIHGSEPTGSFRRRPRRDSMTGVTGWW